LRPGMRKTSITLGAVKILRDEGVFRRGLVIAPVRPCYSVWPAEIAKWTDFSDLRLEILHGPKKEEALQRDADLYCINPEGLAWLLGVTKTKVMKLKGRKIEFDQTRIGEENISVKTEIRYDLSKLKQLKVDTLIVDEASKFRKPNTDRFDSIKQILELFERRFILTGSPAPKWLLDLFGVMYLVDAGYSLGRYITHYRRQFFIPSGYGGYDWQPQEGAKERIYDRIAPSVFSLRDRDYIKLPKLVEVPVQIELPPAARKLYDEVEKEFFAELDNGTAIVAANAGVASIKCRQIANGGLWLQQEVDDEGRKTSARKWQLIHNAKTEATRDLVDEMAGEQVLIAYDFNHDLERLQVEFKNAPHIGKGISPKQSHEILKHWNTGKITELLGHPAAMGHGLNAQDSNAFNIILYGINPDYELYDQFISRLLRSGNKAECVFVHMVYAKDTVDEVSMRLLRDKECGQTALLDAMNDYSVARRGKALAPKAKRRKL